METVAEYVDAHRITVKVTSGPELAKNEDGWEHYAYRVTLRRPGARPWVRIAWHQGTGIKGEPAAADVFGSLVLDGWGAHASQGFTDWALQYGVDPDSRQGEMVYRKCLRTRDRLVEFLGAVEELEHVACDLEGN